MQIHRPAQALLGMEGEGPMKIRKPAQALWRLIPQPPVCFCVCYVFGDPNIYPQEKQTVVG